MEEKGTGRHREKRMVQNWKESEFTPFLINEVVLLGSAYCLIFWVQNVGLCLVPLLIGKLRVATNGYLVPMIVFASFGVLAFFLSLMLKVEDKKKGYGLELPNKK